MKKMPDDRGYFGAFGGRFVPETLMAPLAELEEAYRKAGRDRGFQARLDELLEHYVGRPTPGEPRVQYDDYVSWAEQRQTAERQREIQPPPSTRSPS